MFEIPEKIHTLQEDPGGGEASQTSRSFDEWLENVAISEGISEDEALDRMISSYWILHELTSLVEDTGEEGAIEGDPTSADLSTGPPPSRDGAESVEEEFQRLMEVVKVLGSRNDDADSSTESPVDDREVGRSMDRVFSEIDRLHDDVDRLNTRIDSLVDGNRGSGGWQTRPSPSGTWIEDSEFDELATQVKDLSSTVGELESRHETERQRINENFGHVEDILQYLVGRMDDLDDRVGEATDQLSSIESGNIDRDHLKEIKRSANELGIDEATCERCNKRVDLSLLERAECPSCEHPFDSLSSENRWLGLVEDHKLTLTPSSDRPTEPTASSDTSDQTDKDDNGGAADPPTDVLSELPMDLDTTGGNSEGDQIDGDDFEWDSNGN